MATKWCCLTIPVSIKNNPDQGALKPISVTDLTVTPAPKA